jgi:alpha-tubulin suppressor-like RCC1 family protein
MSTLDLGKVKQLWRGTWSASGTYAVNDVVAYNGAIWICTQGQSVGNSTEYSPGKRDRINVLGKTIDQAELNTINVTVQTVGTTNLFFLDNVQTSAITLYTNVRYRFYQKDVSNLNHRFALSSTPDGFFGGGVEYTNGITFTGTAGTNGQIDVVLPSNAPSTLYYFSANDTGFGAGSLGRFTVSAGWRGWQYWDQITTGFTFKGGYATTTQYYYNDVVEYQGATYVALADNINKQPSSPMNNHYWLLMVPGDRRADTTSVGWLANHGPIDWPYPHGNNMSNNTYAMFAWISRSGRVFTNGAGNNGSHGISYGSGQVQRNHPSELCFNHIEWWNSRDNGGTGRMTTPDGQPPKCIQIETGWDWAYALFNNGEVWAWGSAGNGDGARGDQDSTSTVGMPRRVEGLQDIKIVKISASVGDMNNTSADSQRHVLALDDQGYVYSWGQNDVGQLGQGDTANRYQVGRIPRVYFGGERVIDICASPGNVQSSSYARTAQDNLYAWGYNANGQLGVGNTNNYYRPIKIAAWVPATYSGIRKWQIVGYAGNGGSLQILDGLGFMWMAGDDQYGHGGLGTNPGNRTSLTRATNAVTPNGSITNFWTFGSPTGASTPTWKISFFRTATGATYVAGLMTNAYYVNGLSANTSTLTTPTLIPTASNIINIKEIQFLRSVTNTATVLFLRDDGRVFAQGYNGYGETGNPYQSGTSNSVDDTGSTSYPLQTFLPPTTRVQQLLSIGTQYTDNYRTHGFMYLTDNGQIYAWGQNRSASSARNNMEGSFVTPSVSFGEGSNVPIPQLLMQGK